MKRLDKLLKAAKIQADTRERDKVREIFERMTTEQLHELVDETPTDERIRDILASVGGLWLLGLAQFAWWSIVLGVIVMALIGFGVFWIYDMQEEYD